MYKTFPYDIKTYPFRDLVQEAFECDDLSRLHRQRADLVPQYELNFDNEVKTAIHDVFYSKLRDDWTSFYQTYDQFITQVVAEYVDEESFLYQSWPNFRCHLPGEQSVHRWHADGDAHHRHPAGEINFCIAITRMFDTNTIWIESEPNKGDFFSMDQDYGECTRFNGNQCVHGNKQNLTDVTRISFDLRVLPRSRYIEDDDTMTNNALRKFKIGSYYTEYCPC